MTDYTNDDDLDLWNLTNLLSGMREELCDVELNPNHIISASSTEIMHLLDKMLAELDIIDSANRETKTLYSNDRLTINWTTPKSSVKDDLDPSTDPSATHVAKDRQ